MTVLAGFSPIRLEVYLHRDGSARVEYLEPPVPPPGGHAGTIGLESPDESTGLQVLHDRTPSPGFTFATPTPFSVCFERQPPALD